jgi:nucleotide-binding universal stress UspA family protein
MTRNPEIKLQHIGTKAPVLENRLTSAQRLSPQLRTGNIVDGILQAAGETAANLICTATAGHDGSLDAMRGSTTERVLRQAPCPVLAVPVIRMF